VSTTLDWKQQNMKHTQHQLRLDTQACAVAYMAEHCNDVAYDAHSMAQKWLVQSVQHVRALAWIIACGRGGADTLSQIGDAAPTYTPSLPCHQLFSFHLCLRHARRSMPEQRLQQGVCANS
jgi:hypothetical protein